MAVLSQSGATTAVSCQDTWPSKFTITMCSDWLCTISTEAVRRFGSATRCCSGRPRAPGVLGNSVTRRRRTIADTQAETVVERTCSRPASALRDVARPVNIAANARTAPFRPASSIHSDQGGTAAWAPHGLTCGAAFARVSGQVERAIRIF